MRKSAAVALIGLGVAFAGCSQGELKTTQNKLEAAEKEMKRNDPKIEKGIEEAQRDAHKAEAIEREGR